MSRSCFYQLDPDPKLCTGLTETALDEVTNPQLAPDLRRVNDLTL